MAKIIVLQGTDNTGKTTTLKILLKQLLEKKARLLIFSNNLAKWLRGKSVGDIWAVCEYNGLTVFLNTAGDYGKIILEQFNQVHQLLDLKHIKIDIYIGAIHDTHSSHQAVNTIANILNAKQTNIQTKTVSALRNQLSSNKKDAEDLLIKI